MKKIASQKLWVELRRLAKAAKKRRAAVAYVSSDNMIKFGKGDLLVTDASDAAIKSGQTSAVVLDRALKKGVHLYSCERLHCKMMVFDNVAVMGSANISRSSAENLIESALITDDPTIVSIVQSAIFGIAESAFTKKIDRGFVERIRRLPVAKQKGGKRGPGGIRTIESRAWIIGLSPVSDHLIEAESEVTNKGEQQAIAGAPPSVKSVSWIRLTGDSGFRKEAKAGDLVIQIWREEKRQGEKSAVVYKSLPILYRQDEPNCTRFYVEEGAKVEKTAIPYRRFRSIMKSVGYHNKLSLHMAREIPSDLLPMLSVQWRNR